MKLPPARVEGFLARFAATPDPAVRALLFYGPDAGLVRERAEAASRGVVADLRDPFRVADIIGAALVADPARLADEVQAMALTGGRRVVRVRDAGDAQGALIERFLKTRSPGDALVVIEAGELAARSSLRRAVEASPDAVAVACYADGPRELAALAREIMAAHRIAVAGEAIDYLAENLGGDRGLSRQELEKLALYVGDGGTLDAAAAAALVGDSAQLTLDDIVYAAADGDAPALERALQRAFDEGAAPVSVLRALLRHFQRLHLSGARIADGAAAEDVINRLRPPVFFRLKDRFKRQLALWSPARAAQTLAALTEAERNTKRTGVPPEAVCRDALLRIARGAATRAARRPERPSPGLRPGSG